VILYLSFLLMYVLLKHNGDVLCKNIKNEVTLLVMLKTIVV